LTAPIGLDSSVAIPLLAQAHPDHPAVHRWWNGRSAALCGHALTETYSVLTRLPGDLHLTPAQVVELIEGRFDPPLLLSNRTTRRLPALLAAAAISGGATYDALVALTAVEHDVLLATRDGRARNTYEAIGARVVLAG
jgi:predicted nucleic acid-binding protein